MTVFLPEPMPLEMPPGDPAAVDEVERDVGGAAFWLDVLGDELSGPAASAPGWLGDDATAAAAQLVRVAGIAGQAATAVRAASRRLSVHGDLLRETRRGVAALRAEQEEDLRAAWSRLQALGDVTIAMRTGAPEAVAIVADFEATEAARHRRHAALLEELADDAAATGRVLADAAAPVGGTGRPGDGGRVLAYLAAELPGWGRPEMAGRGRALADALVRRELSSEERAALVADAAALAGDPAFATALIGRLGKDGVGRLLEWLGQDPDGPDNPVAAVLASALGAAVPGEGAHDGVSAALGATYVRPDGRYGGSELAAAGMAAVLSAGVRAPGGGPRMATVGLWARQLLVREHAQGGAAGLPPAGGPWRRDAFDPAALAVGIVARGGEPGVAAALLGDQRVWEAALLRFWGDGGTALGELVEQAGRDPGPAGDRAVRVGLETVGAGLVEGDPSDRTVDRDTVAAVSPALGLAVTAHLAVVTDPLAAVARGSLPGDAEHLLKGLAYVSVDRQAADVVDTALRNWAVRQPLDLAGSGPTEPLAAVAVPSAYLAVQDHGHRLAYALDGFELKEEAEHRERMWNWTAGLALELLSLAPMPAVALTADVVNAYAPILLDMDGTFDQEEDRGPRSAADDAARQALAALPPALAVQAHAVDAQARAAFSRTVQTLGVPESPRSAEEDWGGATLDIGMGLMEDKLTDRAADELLDRLYPATPFDGLLHGGR